MLDSTNIFHKDVIGLVRKAQEDSHDIAATPNGTAFVVCDGMGGHVGGKQASSIAVRSIVEYLGKEKYPQPVQALNDALQFANMQILGYANEHPELKGMGTTACIVLLQDSEAYIAHVGDSRIYLYLGKEKQLHRITKDHSFVQTLVDAGQITDEEAEHHPNKNRILKALGIKPDLAPSFGRVRPKNGDIFLICSDGLSGMISDSVMRGVLMRHTSLQDRGNTLVNLALEAGGLDNITLELVQIAGSPHSKSAFRSYNPAKADLTTHRYRKWKPVVSAALLSVVVAVLYSLLFHMYAVKKAEDRKDGTRGEIAKTDSLIRAAKKEINEYESQKKSLSDELKTKISKIDGKSGRDKMRQNYNEQNGYIEKNIKETQEKLKSYESRRDSLVKAYGNDSMRLVHIKWRNRK